MTAPLFKHMVNDLTPTAQVLPRPQDVERRSLLRIELPFPAIVRGVDANNQAFEERTILDNLSATSLALKLPRLIEPGTKLFLVVRLSTEPTAPAPRVALRAVVHRVEPQGSTFSVALLFTHYRFLYTQPA